MYIYLLSIVRLIIVRTGTEKFIHESYALYLLTYLSNDPHFPLFSI
jgi:hypothetical protein